MADPTIEVTAIDLITGKGDGTGPARTIRLTRGASGLLASVDGGAPAALGGSGVATVAAGAGITVDVTDPANPSVALTSPVTVAHGGTGQVTSLAAIQAFLTLLTGQKVQVISPDSGINRVLDLFAQNASGDPAIAWRTGTGSGTERAYARADTGGALVVVPSVVGVLTAADEAQTLMTWTKTTLAFFGGGRVAQQAVGAALTDNTTGGTAGVLSATDDATNRQGNFHQIAIKIAAIETALRNYGLATT